MYLKGFVPAKMFNICLTSNQWINAFTLMGQGQRLILLNSLYMQQILQHNSHSSTWWEWWANFSLCCWSYFLLKRHCCTFVFIHLHFFIHLLVFLLFIFWQICFKTKSHTITVCILFELLSISVWKLYSEMWHKHTLIPAYFYLNPLVTDVSFLSYGIRKKPLWK